MSALPFPLPLPWRVGEYAFNGLMKTTGMSWLLLGTDANGVKVVGKVAIPGVSSELISGEADMLSRLKGRGPFLSYRDFRFEGGHSVLIYDYVEGVDLRRRCANEGRLGLFHTLRVGKGVARALEVFAAVPHVGGGLANVVHRDLKPSNILWTPRGEVVLLDLGVGLWRGRSMPPEWSKPETSVGSPAYFSPEQASLGGALNTDCRSDIFSLGLVLWELVMGRTFYNGNSVSDVLLKAQCVADLAAKLEELERVCPDLALVVGCCLARARDDRYRHPKELSRALQQVRIPVRQ